MRRMIAIWLIVLLGGCASATGHLFELCRPTGWVDRVEGVWVIIELDDDEAETLVLPTSCFREPVHGGQRIVDGRIDLAGTESLRREMAEITARLVKVKDLD